MSYGLGLSEKKQARQRRNRFFKIIFYIALIAGAGMYGYYEGQATAERRIADIEGQVIALTSENDRLNDQARAALDKQSAPLRKPAPGATSSKMKFQRGLSGIF